MSELDQVLSEQFRRFEMRARGIRLFPEPVSPVPPFAPFLGYTLPTPVDDGRRPTVISRVVKQFWGVSEPPPLPPPLEEEPEPGPAHGEELVEFQTEVPAKLDIRESAFGAFLDNLGACRYPLAFELLGTTDQIVTQFISSKCDASLLRRQLASHFPEVQFVPTEKSLLSTWAMAGDECIAFEFGLEQEFVLPLATGVAVDPFVGLLPAMSELGPEEVALFQVIFEQTDDNWQGSAWRALTGNSGQAIFVDAPKLLAGAKAKFVGPLYGVVVRVAAKASTQERAFEIAREMAFALRGFALPEGNALQPLQNEDYPLAEHELDVVCRQSRRSGMVLNTSELMGLVHFPGSEVRSPALRRALERTKAAPPGSSEPKGLLLGENVHRGRPAPVSLSVEERVRHMHLIGASGTGKSTLLLNLIRQDIENGQGVGVLDPHGDLIDRILEFVPPERIEDVVLVDPADEAFSVGFNILSAHSDLEKNLLASDLVSVFERLSQAWGDQMGSVLRNAILAFLESSQGGTLSDLRRFLIEPTYRDQFLATVRDPDIVYYWRKGFSQLTGNKSVGPVLTRLETFLSPKPIRYMVAQTENRLDFAEILDGGKIFLAKLPQGQIGKENSFLLGSLLVAKFQQLAMGRQSQAVHLRRPFWLYIDEFHNFITPSMAEILTGARKYRLGLILAHQELRQLERDREVASAVMSNPYTRIVFRVGDADARALENGFSFFEARDLQNLQTGQAICRIEKAGQDFNLAVPLPDDPDQAVALQTREAVIASSRRKYATPRAEIEAALLAKFQESDREAPPGKTKAPEKARTQPSTPEPAIPPPHLPPEPPKTIPEDPLPTPASPPASAPTIEPERHSSGRKPATAPGRGGAQHQAIAARLKAAAEDLGFRSTIERPVLDGRGSIDLLLERADLTLACEISITTTIDHEVGNVVKCLTAGFSQVAVICLRDEHRARIQAAVTGSLGADVAKRVSYFDPEEFIAHLHTLPVPPPQDPDAPKIRRGFKVKRSAANLSPEEQKLRENAAIQSIAEAMKRKRRA